MINLLSLAILCLCGVTIRATVNPSCEKPKATVCHIAKLPAGMDITLPDLSRRTKLSIKEGTLKNLTQAMIAPTGSQLRTVHLDGLGMESVYLLPNFEEVRLRNNRLSTIVLPSGESSFALKVLDLSRNQFKNISQLAAFTKLEELNLDDNFIGELPMGMFEGMENLRVLSVARNNLTKVVTPTGSGEFVLPNLETLSLAFNQLQEIQMMRWQLPSLKDLLLNDNQLVQLSELDGFDRFYSLEKLALARNRWSCAWLVHALQNVTKPGQGVQIVRGPADENQQSCTFEKVAGICCQFNVAEDAGTKQLFDPEVENAREMTMRIDKLHDEYLKYGAEKVTEFAKHVREQIDKLTELVQSGEPQVVTLEHVLHLREDMEEITEKVAEHEKLAEKFLEADKEQKRLLHFMVDMKNKLVGQAIDADRVLDLVEQEKASFDQQLKAHLAKKVV